MHLPAYSLLPNNDYTLFDFYSLGPKGSILKRIIYQATWVNNVFNLVLGDVDSKKNTIDDGIVSNNHDTQKVLTTIAQSIYFFYEKHPDAILMIQGNSKTRNRLYRMALSKYLPVILVDFEILCLINNQWISFHQTQQFSCMILKKRISL